MTFSVIYGTPSLLKQNWCMIYRREIFIEGVVFMLILLWVYTSLSKILVFNQFKVQMSMQTVPNFSKPVLPYFLPLAELFLATLLMSRVTRIMGLWLSSFFMIVFTGYILLVITGSFGRVPCSCGGIFEKLGWTAHFIVNLIILLFTLTASFISLKKGGVVKHKTL